MTSIEGGAPPGRGPSSIERVHSFGPDGALVGIVTLPPEPLRAASERAPFVILLNAGLVHRVGPFGMGVELARALAASGLRVLRFDQSGLGDSPPRTGDAPVETQVVADGRAAMDSLAERYGAASFVIGGMCSGALNAHRITASDPRVVGMWMLDGYAYPTRLYYQQRLTARLRDPSSWSALARRAYDSLETRVAERRGQRAFEQQSAALVEADARKSIFYQDWPPIEDARADIEAMLRRGVRLLFAYTAGWSSFVDARQFDEMFPRLPRRSLVTVAYYPRADHSYVALDDRAAMVKDVCGFASSLATPD